MPDRDLISTQAEVLGRPGFDWRTSPALSSLRKLTDAIRHALYDTMSDRRSPARLCSSGESCTIRAHAFLRLPPPRWAFSSPGPCPHQGSFPQKSGCHDHIPPSLRTTCRTAAASPRTIPRNAGAQINQAAGHAVIWGATLGVRRDAQGARDGKLSVPRRRWRVCAIDHILKNEPTATTCAWFSTAWKILGSNRPAQPHAVAQSVALSS